MNSLFPRGCAGCGEPDEVMCPRCRECFYRFARRVMPKSLIVSGEVVSCAHYEGVARHAILQWKDHGDLEVGGILGAFLADVAQRAVFQPTGVSFRAAGEEGQVVAVVPVPSSLRSRLRRGRLQTLELADAVTARLLESGIAAVTVQGLTMEMRTKKAVQSFGVKSRQARAQGGFEIVPSHFPSNCGGVLLIDDICTTGSTVLGCARLLHAYGYRVVSALTVASVPDTGDTGNTIL